MAQLWPTRDLENVDPATGLLSTLNSIGPAAGGKKGVAVAKGTPFADLTSLFGGQVPMEDDQAHSSGMLASLRQVPPVKEAPKLPLSLFPSAGNWQTAAPSTSTTGSLRMMR